MFGRQGGRRESSNAFSSALVEFRAGRMNMIGTMVYPDVRKGLVYMIQGDDGLMHFCWKDRITGRVEEDLIVFPDDYEFKRVEQCKTGRVYVLKFNTSSNRMFFWMQEPLTDRDDEYCRRVNDLINHPPSPNNNDNELIDLGQLLNSLTQRQLHRLVSTGVLRTLLESLNRDATNNSSSRTLNSKRRRPSASENRTSSIRRASPTARTSRGASRKSTNMSGNEPQISDSVTRTTDVSRGTITIDLSTAITSSDTVHEILADPVCANTLSVHLPTTDDSDQNRQQEIKETLYSPQFKQTLRIFSNALQSAQLGPALSRFDLPPAALTAANKGDMEQFLKALEEPKPNTTQGKDNNGNKE